MLVNSEPAQQPDGLSLDELNIAPAWTKTPAKSFDHHAGEDRERKPARSRPDQPRRDRPRERGRRPVAAGKPAPARPPAKPSLPPLAIEVTFIPEEKALAPMFETMKQSSRAYALFDLAKLILNRAERHRIKLARKDGPLYRTLLEENVFLTEADALRYTFRRCGDRLFSEAKKPVEPPKGNFQFVNRCGLTGEWLGPPNFHEYQSRLVKHHQSRLPHVPFEKFKASIETVRDEAAVRAWIESRSTATQYTCLLCREPVVFDERADAENHVRQNHLSVLVATSPVVELTGVASRQLEGRLLEFVRQRWEQERRFPIGTVNELRPYLMKAGFHFFKRDRSITYVTPIKLNRFESIAHLTEHVQKIITFLRANPNATRKQLIEHFGAADETLLAADLHWLIQDGYVVEFFDGRLWAPEDKKPAVPQPAPAS